ncbi:MAG: sigma-54-dependent Fis family transcriptional regulator [Saprospirales bacterium]|nr:sigma-54-dependent Fis family transcriptional regulator [Saprospirales bacterium]
MTDLQTIKARFGIIGRSELLDRALGTAVRVSATDLAVLIVGESGVGKEVFSKIIHALSARKHENFIAVNCGAIPAGTINSELFGHEKGSFTGATADRKGYFETVNGGTIFLDEVSEMPLDTQSFLLRILESGEFMRVGSSSVLKTDVRIIAATNVELEERVRKGKFREDLFYRLSTVPIKVPSLKERREDIPLLFRKFTLDFSERYRTDPIQLEDTALTLLMNYHWPGNVRELKNLAEQISVLSEKRTITAEDLLRYLPQISQRHLPMIPEAANQNGGGHFQEREILYKLLFDMKADLNDLKNLVFELIRRNDLNVPEIAGFDAPMASFREAAISASQKPILMDKEESDFHKAEELEVNLSLEEMEKELIERALKKHGGRRKDAAQDLGISERTLYRKIKQYLLQ